MSQFRRHKKNSSHEEGKKRLAPLHKWNLHVFAKKSQFGKISGTFPFPTMFGLTAEKIWSHARGRVGDDMMTVLM
jgi:hypothetical protein